MTRSRSALLAISLTAWSGALCPAAVHAQPVAPEAPSDAPLAVPAEPRPWAAGVSDSEQALALELYEAGNAEFAESRFAQALTKYAEAIAHWDHPAIRFNMAVCLINLGQPIEAREHLERSLAHGIPAVGAEAHAQAITYRKLLDAQLTHVTITCPEPGAQVTLDGKPLFTGPGAAMRYLLPGEHQVVATKPGLQAALHTLALTAGSPVTLELRPTLALATPPQLERRWATWKPWAVLGGGGVVLGLGTLSYFSAKRGFDSYDRQVAQRCPNGCSAEMLARYVELADEKRSAERKQVLAFSLFAVAGVAVASGSVGLLLNQPRVRASAGVPPSLVVVPFSGGAVVARSWGF